MIWGRRIVTMQTHLVGLSKYLSDDGHGPDWLGSDSGRITGNSEVRGPKIGVEKSPSRTLSEPGDQPGLPTQWRFIVKCCPKLQFSA
jgi:hypothetical protein